jgi:hydrogenase/urease accessory protein HupE
MRLALALVLLLAAADARAHGQDPSGLSVVELAPGVFQVDVAPPVALEFPAGCVRVGSVAHCAAPPARFELRGLREATLARVELFGATAHLAVLEAGDPLLVLPTAPAWTTTARDYAWLGVLHLVFGWDHLVFLLGLLLLARTPRAAVLSLTAFTLGHSLTLSAAVLGWLVVPTPLAELAIAGSILVLALDVVQGRATSRLPLLGAGLGLLHGLGFASVLVEAGLPPSDVPLALACFNLGIELGQLAIALAVLPLLRFARPHAGLLGHAMGALGAMWCLQRAAMLLS